MRKLLNTLYITRQDVYVHQEGQTVVVEEDKKILLQLPIHTVSSIVCFGNIRFSPFLFGLCGEHGVHISFLTEYGKFLARVTGKFSGNVLLRMNQMKTTFNEQKILGAAKSFVIGKVMNSRNLLLRRLRDHGENAPVEEAKSQMALVLKHLRSADSIDCVRGYEGEAANIYFSVFNELILTKKNTFHINGRNRRPPLDPMNALLSFLYTILLHDCEAALESVGLDPQIGFLHTLRPGRASLACDLMEELRVPLVDRLALTLVNLNQITEKGFRKTELGSVEMTDDVRKVVLTAWQKRKQEVVIHPFIDEKIPIGLIPFVQAQLLAKFVRGDLDSYPPYLVK